MYLLQFDERTGIIPNVFDFSVHEVFNQGFILEITRPITEVCNEHVPRYSFNITFSFKLKAK